MKNKFTPATAFKFGEENPAAKLTEADVQYIRDNYFPFQCTAIMLGRQFGVHYTTIRKIVKGIRWPNGEIRTEKYRRFSEEQVRKIWKLREKGHGYRKIASALNLSREDSPSLVRNILAGKTYKWVVRA